ncbi:MULTISPECIES: DUF4189 domain-containing protein [Pseudomonas]|uniref:DUF4189 domain-containing protein n=1 Tax=Pseudomonas phytophila TaxID=2867264 RepID=A0ABY6F792_9PSED|nr:MULTISPECIES: DUF4189 domain-containing protein [Pseudomonas]MCD5987894.1 DUF4189 domain-containing protein [Pseudomonas quasicaspiana]MDU8357719.1 DUF4189 domain-containing protein [Pseudomonas syringae group sp. J309-1]UXZ93749.1 DUF4189 domain-containing protein [Pseudomonas phytophila]
MGFKVHLVSISLLLFSLQAGAQTRCPMGVQAGSIQCIPDDPQTSQSAPPRMTGEWIKTWGAVAGSDATGESGAVVGKLTEEEARSVALHRCALGGATDCKVNLAYKNQCVALISSEINSVVQGSVSEQRAIDLAMASCKEDSGGRECKVLYTACSDPIFRKY